MDEIWKSKRHSRVSWDCNNQVEENFYATHVQPEVLRILVALCVLVLMRSGISVTSLTFLEKKTYSGVPKVFGYSLLLVYLLCHHQILSLVYLLWDCPKAPSIRELCGDSLTGCKSLSAEVAGAFLKILLSYRVVPFQLCCGRKSTVSCFLKLAADMTMKLQEMKSKTKQLEQAPSKSDVFTTYTVMWDDHRVFHAQWTAWFRADAFCHICFPSMQSCMVRGSCSTFGTAFGVRIKTKCCQEKDNWTLGYQTLPGRQW